jgi:predicted enzyme related to lactoylglutathione lyase
VSWLHAVIDVPAAAVPAAATFWSQALGWELGPPWSGHPELRSFQPDDGDAYVHLQDIHGDARTHIDLEVADITAELARLLTLGATVGPGQDRWQPMTSPGGLPFCLVQAAYHQAPAPLEWPDGHRTRLVQVCIDSPPGLHDAEVEFWQAVLGWRWESSSSPEFAGKLYDDLRGFDGGPRPDRSPLQLLFQRLDRADGPATAHLDLGSDAIDAEVARLGELGAERLWPGDGWVALRDPAGIAFCVTGNSPEYRR